jgi:hypothetical protein
MARKFSASRSVGHEGPCFRRFFVAVALFSAATGGGVIWESVLSDGTASRAGAAERNDSKVRIIRSLPQSEEELSAAFEASVDRSCRPVASGRALEMRALSPAATESAGLSVNIKIGKRELPVPMARRSALSVGLVVRPDDRDALPLLSSALITDFIDSHYVCLQALIRRDLDSGELHLHDAAPAMLVRYSGERLTQKFEPLVLESLKNTRVLGLFVPSHAEPAAENMRTLVLIVGTPMLESTTPQKITMAYELLFVYGVPTKNDSGEDDLALHSFLTADKRTSLHDLGTFEPPADARGCDSTGAVHFTRYAADGLTPTGSALRALDLHSRRRFSAAELKGITETAGAGGEWLKRPTAVFTAILQGKP